MRHLVTGAGGFIGGHLVGALLERGDDVRAVDVKPRGEWWQHFDEAENAMMNLRERECCQAAVEGVDRVWNLATDMGGIGYLSAHKLEPMRSVLINTHLLEESAKAGVQRYLFTSSACIYGEGTDTREELAYPADCEDGYGWEKLFSERMCRHYTEERGLPTRVARLHNVYGPHGSWNDGREKAPAALCRKVAEAVAQGEGSIEIWGDGRQQRSFLYIADCLEGLQVIMDGSHSEPVNLGSEEMVSIAQLARKVEQIAGVVLNHRHDSRAPRGVKGRNSQNDLLWERYEWRPRVSLDEGLVDTYEWVSEQVRGADAEAERENDRYMESGQPGGYSVKIALVTTTVHVPWALRTYRKKGPGVPIVIAGDRKSPHDEIEQLCEVLGDATYLRPEQQADLYPDLSFSIGWDSIQRRNIAILEAAKLEPDVIVSVDDDNWPRGDYFGEIEAAFSKPHRGYVGQGAWFNIGEFAQDSYTYRGFPYRFREPEADYGVNGDGAEIGIVNGLIYGDPDINAVERARTDPQVRSYDSEAEAGMALDPAQTWSPINSQNTAWRAELAPLMLLPPRLGRYDDIWGSYIAQRVLAGTGLHVLFGKPFVEQKRNPHDLEKDLRDEAFGAAYTLQFTEALQRAELPEGTVVERLEAALDALSRENLDLPLDFFDAWLAAWS